MRISLIIVTYNNEQQLSACLASVYDQVDEVVIVDNASTDGTRKIATNSKVKWVLQSHNMGFAAAANAGALQATGDTLFFLNADTIVTAGAVKRTQGYIVTHPEVGIVGMGLFDANNKPERYSFGSEPHLLNVLLRKIRPSTYPTQALRTDWVSGGAFFISSKTFKAIGGFDPTFFLYWEDVDLCRRVRELGKTVVLLPTAKVIHQRGASLSDSTKKKALYDKSADRYYQKHYPTLICQIQHLLRLFYRSV